MVLIIRILLPDIVEADTKLGLLSTRPVLINTRITVVSNSTNDHWTCFYAADGFTFNNLAAEPENMVRSRPTRYNVGCIMRLITSWPYTQGTNESLALYIQQKQTSGGTFISIRRVHRTALSRVILGGTAHNIAGTPITPAHARRISPSSRLHGYYNTSSLSPPPAVNPINHKCNHRYYYHSSPIPRCC